MTLADLRAALADLQHRAGDRFAEMQQQAHDAMAHWHLPVLPSREELAGEGGGDVREDAVARRDRGARP